VGWNELCPTHTLKRGRLGHKELCLCPLNTPHECVGVSVCVEDSQIGACRCTTEQRWAA
jgi:hypothetical protein